MAACSVGEVVAPHRPLGADGSGAPGSPGSPSSGDGSATGRASNLVLSKCDGSDAPTTRPLQRLSAIELKNSVDDIVRASVGEETADAVLEAVAPLLDDYQGDDPRAPKVFRRMDQDVHGAHAEGLLRLGAELGRQLTASPQRLAELARCSKSATRGCLDEVIATLGKRVLRHPLSQAEHAFYKSVYDADEQAIDPEGLADVIAVMISSPSFFYRLEYLPAKSGSEGGTFPVDDYALAAQLSYQFWQSTPDDALLAAAEAGELRDQAGFEKQLDRILSDPRASATMQRFAREWLHLDELEPFDKNADNDWYAAFAKPDRPSATLHEQMIEDTGMSLAYHALQADDTIAGWLKSPYAFAQPELAALYGTPPWNGSSKPPVFPKGERAGLITRAALVASKHGTANTSPILKGVLLRKYLLCDELGPPAADFDGVDPGVVESATTRELTEALTHRGTCAGCHEQSINPLGFVTEGYDALGRVRKQQPLYNTKTGEFVKSLPLKLETTPHVRDDKDTRVARTPSDLADMIVESGKVEKCFAMSWVRYSAASIDEKGKTCEAETLRSALDSGMSIKKALRQYALRPAFRQRYVPPAK